MKKTLLAVAMMFGTISGYSQSSVGLVAHWDMNGSANDVSGNGHNGTLHNVVSDTGQTGMVNTAYYFDGVSSYISIPASPAFNISQYSICAKVKVQGFYSGNCQGNVIFERGNALGHTPGSYALAFDDNQADSNCAAMDTTQDIFYGGDPLVPAYSISAYYTPTIIENQWYNVVVTLNDTVFKTYINGVLKVSYPVTSPGGFIGTSTDSASIGANIYGITSGEYQFYFKGSIDDIMLYNRVLTDSEVVIYHNIAEVNNIVSSNMISVYPNPAHDNVSVQIKGNNTKGSIQLINEIGQILSQQNMNSATTTFDLGKLPSGIYIVRVQIDGAAFYQKVIKQ